MTDALQVARERRKEHEAAIAEKRLEIEELEEMIGDLDRFLEFGEELIGESRAKAAERPITRPISQPVSRPVSQPAPAAIADKDDDWEESDPTESIARMLAARNG